jgi:hypothetical protein
MVNQVEKSLDDHKMEIKLNREKDNREKDIVIGKM